MIIDLNELNKSNVIEFNYEVKKDEELDNRIDDLVNTEVSGKVYLNDNSDIIIDALLKGTMVIPDSITLDRVPYDFSINIEENLKDLEENYENCYDIRQNTLDLKRILWQNIVLEVPMRFTKVKDAHLKGNGWELINEKDQKDEIDPRLKDLEKLLKGDD